jgi:hypothetical protein
MRGPIFYRKQCMLKIPALHEVYFAPEDATQELCSYTEADQTGSCYYIVFLYIRPSPKHLLA